MPGVRRQGHYSELARQEFQNRIHPYRTGVNYRDDQNRPENYLDQSYDERSRGYYDRSRNDVQY